MSKYRGTFVRLYFLDDNGSSDFDPALFDEFSEAFREWHESLCQKNHVFTLHDIEGCRCTFAISHVSDIYLSTEDSRREHFIRMDLEKQEEADFSVKNWDL